MFSDKGGIKNALKVAAQHNSGELLEVVCIPGGPITQVEQDEMPDILRGAKADAEKSGVALKYRHSTMAYADFLEQHG